MLAAVRPDSWNLPLFLHVLGAMLLVGTTAASAALALAGWRSDRDWLFDATLRTILLGVLPAWLLTRAAAQWILDKWNFGGDDPGWVGVGFAATEPGLVLLLLAALFAWLARRRNGGWPIRVAAVLLVVYSAALAVAWWVMSAKP
jgi:hypothetical protein